MHGDLPLSVQTDQAMPLNPADAEFVNRLQHSLPDDQVRAPDVRYLQEPRNRWTGKAGCVVLPRSVQDVALVVQACARSRVGIVPWGGGTGLVGGQVLPDGPAPVILSLERLNQIQGIWPEENVMIAGAGAILQDVQERAKEHDRLFALSLASQGSARIGGLLSTNAGGVNVLRYGNARDQVLGLEAVLPDGSIWNGLKRLRKDNTGYDLRHLLMGAEGTLGIITAASLKLAPRPATSGTAMMVVRSPAAALTLLGMVRDIVGEQVSAFELIHGQGLRFLDETVPETRQPFGTDRPEWSVLIELGLAQGQDAQAALETVFLRGHEAGLVSDGVIAQSAAQATDFWAVREMIPEANKRVGAISSHDVSVPLSDIARFIDEGMRRLATLGPLRINAFGHLGDGNLHYNVYPPKGKARSDYAKIVPQIQRMVHDLADEFGGSVSAEHGIGRLKVDDLQRYGDPAKLGAMRAIKSALDPNGIMNPGAVLATA